MKPAAFPWYESGSVILFPTMQAPTQSGPSPEMLEVLGAIARPALVRLRSPAG